MLRKYIKSCELLHELDRVRTIVIKDLDEVPVSHIEALSITHGSEVDLPYWLAKALSKQKYCEVKEVNDLVGLLRKFKFLEWTTATSRHILHKLPKDIYYRIKECVEKGMLSKNDPLVYDLSKLRLNKLIDISRLGVKEEILQNLTIEERVILNILSTVIGEWINYLMRGEI